MTLLRISYREGCEVEKRALAKITKPPVLDATLDEQETTVPKVFDILPIRHAKGLDHQGQGQDLEILGQDDVNGWQGRISARS